MTELKQVLEAQLNLSLVLTPTRLIFSEYFSELFSRRVYFKPENLQITGSFKIRGAYYKLFKISQQPLREKKVICASAGNHAQGMAWAGRKLGFSVKVVLPKFAPVVKIEAIKKLGAEIVLFGDNLEEAYLEALRISSKEGSILVHPYDDETVIAGQGTIGLEILGELPGTASVIIPIGGGGLAAGVSLAIKERKSNVRIIGVRSKSKLAEGIFVKKIGDISGALVKKYVDQIVFAGEEEIASAILMLMEKSKLMVEGAGAAGLAALLGGKISNLPDPIVIVLSGGNIDITMVGKIIRKGLHGLGRMVSVVIEVEDKPGILAELTSLIAAEGANIYDISHARSLPRMSLTKSQVRFVLETWDEGHALKIIAKLKSAGCKIQGIYK